MNRDLLTPPGILTCHDPCNPTEVGMQPSLIFFIGILFSQGYMPRQPLYFCLTCNPVAGAGGLRVKF